jgi:hypothetical protein
MPIMGKYIITLTLADVGTQVTNNSIVVKRIHCLGNATTSAGNQWRIEDINNQLLYRTFANGAWYESESITQRDWPTGFRLVTMNTGEMDIEYELHGKTVY